MKKFTIAIAEPLCKVNNIFKSVMLCFEDLINQIRRCFAILDTDPRRTSIAKHNIDTQKICKQPSKNPQDVFPIT